MDDAYVYPSRKRIIIAVSVSLVVMILGSIMISLYRNSNTPDRYYPTGEVDEEIELYEDPSSPYGLRIIGERITVLELPEQVHRGDTVRLRIRGRPGAEYSITVYLKSGKSTNSALIPKIADETGVVEWEWKIAHNTSVGKIRVMVLCVDSDREIITCAEMYMNVIPKET